MIRRTPGGTKRGAAEFRLKFEWTEINWYAGDVFWPSTRARATYELLCHRPYDVTAKVTRRVFANIDL